MTSRNKCVRCSNEMGVVKHCERCYNDGWDGYHNLLEENTWLKKILKGIMEIAKVVEE